MSDYLVLGEDEQDDIVVSFMLAQERDKYCHELNIARYEAMLAKLGPGQWRDRISKLRDESTQRLSEVNSIIEESKIQMPPKARIDAAKIRIGGT